jgi:hypothetical protein
MNDEEKHDAGKFSFWIACSATEIAKHRDINKQHDLIVEYAEYNNYVNFPHRAFELIAWFRTHEGSKLQDAVEYVDSYIEPTYFWKHCSQVAERLISEELIDQVNVLTESRRKESA